MRHKKVGERKRLWNNEEREKKRKESKKVRDGLKEQIWRMKEMEERRRASRKSCEGQDKGQRGRNSFVSLTTVEHLVHGEGLQEVGAWVRDARFPPPCGGRGRRGRGL